MNEMMMGKGNRLDGVMIGYKLHPVMETSSALTPVDVTDEREPSPNNSVPYQLKLNGN